MSTVLGISFLGLAIAATYLMFKLWGYPFDKERRKSEAPRWAMNLHRVIGFAYAIIYVIMMIKMVPRLWQYQIEFPPRTVAHIMLGLTIGVILVLKLSILRWFRHFEEWMPTLGVSLLVCTVLLTGLSVPNVLKERTLASASAEGATFEESNRSRVERLLSRLDLPEEPNAADLASPEWLAAGREVLLDECVFCHDLRTAIAKPRSPSNWLRTVQRMQDKPSLGPIVDDREALAVTAYLVAISPELQRSAQEVRQVNSAKTEAKSKLAIIASPEAEAASEPVDIEAAKVLFEEECSLCHPLSDATDAPPTTIAEMDELIARMIDNGMDVEPSDLTKIRAYIAKTYIKSPPQ